MSLKSKRGEKSCRTSIQELRLTLNWTNLAVSLIIAFLAWVSSDLVPALQDAGGTLGVISGLLAVLVPPLVSFLRNNSDLTIEYDE